MMAPEQGAGVVVLINLNGGNASDLAPEDHYWTKPANYEVI